MSTNWPAVLAALGAVAVGAFIRRFRVPISRLQRSQAEAFHYPRNMINRFTPELVGWGGLGFMLIGGLAGLMGLFFGDSF